MVFVIIFRNKTEINEIQYNLLVSMEFFKTVTVFGKT